MADVDDAGDSPPLRSRVGRGAAAGTYGLLGFLAALVDIVTGIVAVIIVVGILLVVLKANGGNAIVKDVHDAAKFLVGPFDGMFEPKNHRLAIAINWGIATVVYVIAGRLIAALLRRPLARARRID
jgi:hypothetical protein